MKHKTNGLKREFVEDTFLDMFYKVHHLDYITDEFLQLALEEYFLNKPIDEDTDIYEYINNLSDDQLASLIIGEFNDDYDVTVKLKNLYVSSLYIQEENEEEWNDYKIVTTGTISRMMNKLSITTVITMIGILLTLTRHFYILFQELKATT